MARSRETTLVAAISGFLALCSTEDDEVATVLTAYPVTAINLTANDQGSIPAIAPNTNNAEAGELITCGALFDAGGNLLMSWKWLPPYTRTPWQFPTSSPRLDLPPRVLHALNGPVNTIVGEAGDVIGTIDGLPLRAGCRLVAHLGHIVAGGLTEGEKRAARVAEKEAARAAFLGRTRLIGGRKPRINSIEGQAND